MKKIPVGVSDFKEIIKDEYYFVDKSLFIKDIIDDGSEVILIPRPRRFGKTLNMSMLRYFFEKSKDENSGLFEGLNIWKEKEYRQYCGKYPVIFISFKDIKFKKWEDAYESLRDLLYSVYYKHKYLIEENFLVKTNKADFENIFDRTSSYIGLCNSLRNLSHYLYEYHNEKVVILIDEYDAAVESSYVNGYYDKMMEFMKNFLSAGLKDNSCLQKGVLTGILRIAKESIFSGLNNLSVYTLLEHPYSDYFGLLEDEVYELAKYYRIDGKFEEVRKWYNGYLFGENTVYNPWSVVNYANKWAEGLKPYWVNTSSNDLVKVLITRGSGDLKKELDELLRGNSIEKAINDSVVYQEIENDTNSIWSFLLFNGYLKPVSKRVGGRYIYYLLAIPNEEVKLLYEQIIRSWFSESIHNDKYELMLKSLTQGDINVFGKIFKEFVFKTFSYFDTGGRESEKTYHAFVLGLLISLGNEYEVKSNKESGYGRYDVMLIPKNVREIGIVFEFKCVDEEDGEDLQICVDMALKQIREKQYRQELLDRGIGKVIEIGIGFSGKDVLVKWDPIYKQQHNKQENSKSR